MTSRPQPRAVPEAEPADTVVGYTIDALRDAIREGRLAPGQRLVVADLTSMLGVSNGPVREAIRRLTGEGLVEIVPHRGAAVRVFDSADLREIFDIREVLEGLAARLAAERTGAAGRHPELAAMVVDMRAILEGGLAYIAHNRAFHKLIYTLAGNARLSEQAGQLTLPLYRWQFHTLMDPAYARLSASEHEGIAAAILAGDGVRAERSMRNHIGSSGRAMIAAAREAEARRAVATDRVHSLRVGRPAS